MFQRHLLNDGDVEPLADGVYTVLEKVGVLCQNAELLDALDAAGAQVDRAAERVRFPRKMQVEFIEHVRTQTAAGGDNGDVSFAHIGLPSVGGQVAQFYYDDATGTRRAGNRADFITLIKLGEVLHGEAGVGHALLLRDVPPMLEPLEAALLLVEHATNPGCVFCWNVRLTDYLIEMGDILGRKHWYSWGANCFAHPLRFDRDVADKFVRRIRAGETAGFTAMPVAGMSAPVTLAGFVVVTAAELFATWLLGRAIVPDAPLGGSMWGGAVDMRGGAVSYCAFDSMLYAYATVEFVRRWSGVHVPVGGGEYCDAREPGLYTALEKAYKAMTIAAFSGRHPSLGSGMLEEGKSLSPVQLLIERDFAAGIRHLARTVDTSPEQMALDEILGVGLGLGMSHMTTDHTLRHFRDSLWLPEFIDRAGWGGPDAETAILVKARDKFHSLIEQYEKPAVDPDTLAALRKVVDRARKELL